MTREAATVAADIATHARAHTRTHAHDACVSARSRDLVTTVVTYNYENGGRRGDGTGHDLRPLAAVAALVPDMDVLLFQEGRDYGEQGSELLFRVEDLLGMRGLRTPSRRGPLDEIVFIRWPRVRPVRHYDRLAPTDFDDRYGFAHLRLPGFPEPVRTRSVQWPHFSGDLRLIEADALLGHACSSSWSLIGGDLNALWPDRDGLVEFAPAWERLPAHARSHKTLPPGLPGIRPGRRWITDTRATTALADAGLVNAGSLARDVTVTVNAHIDDGQGARIDHILCSPRLAQALVPGSYRVLTGPAVDAAGDHRPVTVDLDARRLAPSDIEDHDHANTRLGPPATGTATR